MEKMVSKTPNTRQQKTVTPLRQESNKMSPINVPDLRSFRPQPEGFPELKKQIWESGKTKAAIFTELERTREKTLDICSVLLEGLAHPSHMFYHLPAEYLLISTWVKEINYVWVKNHPKGSEEQCQWWHRVYQAKAAKIAVRRALHWRIYQATGKFHKSWATG